MDGISEDEAYKQGRELESKQRSPDLNPTKKKNQLLTEVSVPNIGTIHRLNEKILSSMFPPDTENNNFGIKEA
jgi:hypothetical protein